MQIIHLNIMIALSIIPKIVGVHNVNEMIFTQHIRETAAADNIDTFTKGTRDHHDSILALWGLLNLISFALRSS